VCGLQQGGGAVDEAVGHVAVLGRQHTTGVCQVQGTQAAQLAQHRGKVADGGIHTAAIKHQPGQSTACEAAGQVFVAFTKSLRNPNMRQHILQCGSLEKPMVGVSGLQAVPE